jgi:hypothetical protein
VLPSATRTRTNQGLAEQRSLPHSRIAFQEEENRARGENATTSQTQLGVFKACLLLKEKKNNEQVNNSDKSKLLR